MAGARAWCSVGGGGGGVNRLAIIHYKAIESNQSFLSVSNKAIPEDQSIRTQCQILDWSYMWGRWTLRAILVPECRTSGGCPSTPVHLYVNRGGDFQNHLHSGRFCDSHGPFHSCSRAGLGVMELSVGGIWKASQGASQGGPP